jgi:phage baseplate assembly protein W
MIEIDITAQLDEVDFGATGHIEILQNVRTIITTPRYSVPLDRNFGLNATMLDEPLPVAKAKLTAEIIAAIHKYEPRVKVTKVLYDGNAMEGVLVPKVRVKIVGT